MSTSVVFRKTLLALAIGTALSAQAQTVQLKPYLELESSTDAVSVTGTYTNDRFEVDSEKGLSSVVTARDDDFARDLSFDTRIVVEGDGIGALELANTEIGGDLVIQGLIDVKGKPVDVPSGLRGVSGILAKGREYYDPAEGLLFTSRVEGSIRNEASISVEGALRQGLDMAGHRFDGELVNAGTIAAKGDVYIRTERYGDRERQYAYGVTALRVAGSEVREGLHNSGTIQAEGTNAMGLEIGADNVLSKLINTGTIAVKGDSLDSVETDLETGESTTVRVVAAAVALNGGNLEQIRNEEAGRIIATGQGSVALDINRASFIDSAADVQIVNAGRIEGEDAGIHIGAFVYSQNDLVEIRNQGDIVSGRAAIEVEATQSGMRSTPVPTLTHLLWEKGTVSGDLLGLSRIDIQGNVTFNRLDDQTATIKLTEGGTLSVATGAHLELGQLRTELEGNLSVADSASLGLVLGRTTHPQVPILKVKGIAAFGAGSEVKLSARYGFSADKTEYRLLEATSLPEHVKVSSASVLLTVDSSRTFSTGNEMILAAEVSRKSDLEIRDDLQGAGTATGRSAENAGRAAEAFSPLLPALLAGQPNDPLAAILGDDSGSEESRNAQRKLLTQLAPDVSGGASQAAVFGQAMIRNVAAGRTGGARGLSSGGAFAQTGVWVQALNSDATQDLRDGVAGFDASTTGIAVGLDGKLNEQLTLGLAYSFLDTDVDAEGGNKTEVQGHNLTLYSGFVQNGFFVDGSLTYGQNANEGERLIATTLAKADYDSNLLGVNLTAGYTYPLQGTVVVEPQVTARYSNVEIDRIEESGSSAALNTEKQRYEVGELGAGVHLVGRIDVGNGSISPRIKLMAYHDLIADQAASTSAFVLGGTPFVTSGAKPERNSYEAGLGADYRLGALTLGVSYDYFGKSDYSSDTFAAKVRYDF
jgi:outer membrane autotransporter protein